MITDRPHAYPLVIDSNADDVQLFLEALENETTANEVSIVSTGGEALDFLERCEADPTCAKPNLVVLDIDLPEMDWRRLLDRFDADSDCAGVPVLVFTERTNEEAIAQSYTRYATAYVRKPTARDEFVDAVRVLEAFWFDTVWLPPRIEANEESQ